MNKKMINVYPDECKGCYIYESIQKNMMNKKGIIPPSSCIINDHKFNCPCWNCLVKMKCDHTDEECPDMNMIFQYIIEWYKKKGIA